jgi:1-acyl-sn-glycerol-3-phosphate acyltransferase
MDSPQTIPRTIARTLLSKEEHKRLEHLVYADAGHGFDRLGLHPDWVRMSVGLFRGVYDRYFRVVSHGAAESIPTEGAAILVANHSGMLPLDATMLYLDVVRNTYPPRVPRIVMDLFVPRLPFVSSLFARVGAVSGARATVRRLLDDGELLCIFPEGTPGISKPFMDRYHVSEWRVGHAELAIRHRVPVIPVAIIGAEEQWIQVGRLERFHVFGAPFLPIPATPIPLPVRYHIYYGAPILLHERYRPEESDEPEKCRAAAELTRAAVEGLIDRGLRERDGVFR